MPAIDYSEFPKQDWENTVYANERGELKENDGAAEGDAGEVGDVREEEEECCCWCC